MAGEQGQNKMHAFMTIKVLTKVFTIFFCGTVDCNVLGVILGYRRVLRLSYLLCEILSQKPENKNQTLDLIKLKVKVKYLNLILFLKTNWVLVPVPTLLWPPLSIEHKTGIKFVETY